MEEPSFFTCQAFLWSEIFCSAIYIFFPRAINLFFTNTSLSSAPVKFVILRCSMTKKRLLMKVIEWCKFHGYCIVDLSMIGFVQDSASRFHLFCKKGINSRRNVWWVLVACFRRSWLNKKAAFLGLAIGKNKHASRSQVRSSFLLMITLGKTIVQYQNLMHYLLMFN